MSRNKAEKAACQIEDVCREDFNESATIPYGLSPGDMCAAMNEFLGFLSLINTQLNKKGIPRLECFLMPANFSSIVGAFMTATLPKHCKSIVKNYFHNGHPDLLPKGVYPDNSILHAKEGIEVKASRYLKGWQGHNPEDVWLMVFCFEANRIQDEEKGIDPIPFRFIKVVGSKLRKKDRRFSGRSATSRRTITASVTRSGYDKMEANWIYRAPK
ncbi:MAG: hypothetical protein IH898_12310 [Planctomycetes bacterium]|nr:hypothetical protein [Planctomycetota bacterium]